MYIHTYSKHVLFRQKGTNRRYVGYEIKYVCFQVGLLGRLKPSPNNIFELANLSSILDLAERIWKHLPVVELL